jgi:WD40 repeat protein
VPSGDPIAVLKADRISIESLAFGPDLLRREDAADDDPAWLLAAGDAGGSVTIWDLRLHVPRSVCRGSAEVLALAFRPDGMTLASTGQGSVKLWDLATGRLLLELPGSRYTWPLAFSSDGKHLAVGKHGGFHSPRGLDVWELEDGRGLEEWRGLLGLVNQVIFSPDGRWVAGLSNDWKVAVWDRKGGHLRHVLEVPVGFHPDNAGLAFDADGRRLAVSAGVRAAMWDVDSGRRIKTWPLPPGLVDNLAFSGDRLLSFREETASGKVPPTSESDRRAHPRVGRIRDLLAVDAHKPIREIRDFSWHMYCAQVSPRGGHLVVVGLDGPPETGRRISKLYELSTGRELASIPTQVSSKVDHAYFRFDPTGTVMFHVGNWSGPLNLLAIPSLKLVGSIRASGIFCIGPGATTWLGHEWDSMLNVYSLMVWSQGRAEPLFQLPRGSALGPAVSQFSSDGRHICWSLAIGTATVFDLVEIQRRLAEIGLGW